jgi:shikimate dehydrogenase
MTGIIPLAGVIGRPVAHSLSPRLHRHWLDRMGIAGHYVPLDVAPGNLRNVLRVLPTTAPNGRRGSARPTP